MNRKTMTAGLLMSLLGTLSSCGGGQTQPPGKIEAQTIAFDLRDKITSPLWTYGPGTLTLRRAELSDNPGPKVTEAAFDTAGRGNITLPGEAQGVLTQADQAVSAALHYFVPRIMNKCVATFTESNMNARALFVGQADFATQDGGLTLRFFHLENVNGTSEGFQEMLVFVNADNTLSGNIVCGTGQVPVNLTFKRGWNSLTLSIVQAVPFNAKPISTLSLTVEGFDPPVATPASTP